MPAKRNNLHSFLDFFDDPLISGSLLVLALIALIFSILQFIAAVNA